MFSFSFFSFILHFFTIVVYIKSGGAARFKAVVNSFADRKPLILFSGDAFNPSVLSSVTMGKQMPPVLNEIGAKNDLMNLQTNKKYTITRHT